MGISANDVKKLRDNGYCTIQSVLMNTRKSLVQIKGLNDGKVDKIIE